MDAKYVNPFIDGVRLVFDTMIHMEVSLGKPQITEILPRHDISGIIGMTGDVVGSIVLSFPEPVAKVVITKFACQDLAVGTSDFADALGEIVNMISGVAKAKFTNKCVSISTPSVVIGPGHTIARPARTTCVCLPCHVACGEFSIDIAIREESQKLRAA